MRHRLTIRWWPRRGQWIYGVRWIRGEYVGLHVGPLEVVGRTRKRVRRLYG